ncbi:MAG: hypothetical protein MN733_36505 [Nitrososphaera sp.]|nr:hypothetical protein [Nitrososphaera sp.]
MKTLKTLQESLVTAAFGLCVTNSLPAEVDRPKLDVAREGNAIILSWPGSGSLERSETLANGWILVPGASSPYPVPVVGRAAYFRLSLTSGPKIGLSVRSVVNPATGNTYHLIKAAYGVSGLSWTKRGYFRI